MKARLGDCMFPGFCYCGFDLLVCWYMSQSVPCHWIDAREAKDHFPLPVGTLFTVFTAGLNGLTALVNCLR